MKSSFLTGQKGNWSSVREENWLKAMFWVSGRTWSGGQSSYFPDLVVGWLVLSHANQELNGLIKTPKEKIEEAKPQWLPVSEHWFSLITGAWVCLLAFWLASRVQAA